VHFNPLKRSVCFDACSPPYPTNQALVLSDGKQPGNMVCEGCSGRYLQKRHANLDNTSTFLVGTTGAYTVLATVVLTLMQRDTITNEP
jgi:hypothetical protein